MRPVVARAQRCQQSDLGPTRETVSCAECRTLVPTHPAIVPISLQAGSAFAVQTRFDLDGVITTAVEGHTESHGQARSRATVSSKQTSQRWIWRTATVPKTSGRRSSSQA